MRFAGVGKYHDDCSAFVLCVHGHLQGRPSCRATRNPRQNPFKLCHISAGSVGIIALKTLARHGQHQHLAAVISA